jgi:hypothetical protein
MTDSGQRTFSGNLFERNKNCDADINEALKKEKRTARSNRQEHVPIEGFASRTRSFAAP